MKNYLTIINSLGGRRVINGLLLLAVEVGRYTGVPNSGKVDDQFHILIKCHKPT